MIHSEPFARDCCKYVVNFPSHLNDNCTHRSIPSPHCFTNTRVPFRHSLTTYPLPSEMKQGIATLALKLIAPLVYTHVGKFVNIYSARPCDLWNPNTFYGNAEDSRKYDVISDVTVSDGVQKMYYGSFYLLRSWQIWPKCWILWLRNSEGSYRLLRGYGATSFASTCATLQRATRLRATLARCESYLILVYIILYFFFNIGHVFLYLF